MKILVINCGSSSLKYQLIDMEGEKVLCKGLCERIGMESSMITHDANVAANADTLYHIIDGQMSGGDQ